MNTPLSNIRSLFLDLLDSIVIFSNPLLCKATVGKMVFCKYVQSLGSNDADLDGPIDQIERSHGVAILMLSYESIVTRLV